MHKSSQDLVRQAEAEIVTIPVAEARAALGTQGVLFVDLREKGELRREGRIPGALSVPRGLLEFWVDPESPYFNQAFGGNQRLVLFCAAGWRSALAAKTLQDMGHDRVCHIEGGFGAWREAGAPVEAAAQNEGPA